MDIVKKQRFAAAIVIVLMAIISFFTTLNIIFPNGYRDINKTGMQLEWERNKAEHNHLALFCDEPSSANSCYLFTGYYYRVYDEGKVIHFLDDNQNMIVTVNKQCIVAPVEQFNETACSE